MPVARIRWRERGIALAEGPAAGCGKVAAAGLMVAMKGCT